MTEWVARRRCAMGHPITSPRDVHTGTSGATECVACWAERLREYDRMYGHPDVLAREFDAARLAKSLTWRP